MQPFRRILVGVDFSDCSRNALREAARLAAIEGAELRAIHILHGKMADAVDRADWQTQPAIRLGSNAKLEQFVAEVIGARMPAAVSCQTFAANRLAQFMRQAHEFAPDLLVLGHRGAKSKVEIDRRDRVLASECVRGLKCTVLLTNDRHQVPYRNIVVAIDFSERSRRALIEAAELCRSDGATLHVIHVHTPPWIHFMNYPSAQTRFTESDEERYRKKLVSELFEFIGQFQNDYDDLSIEIHPVEAVNVATGIIRYVEQTDSDLIVLGTSCGPNRSHLHLPVGSIAETVIRGVECSLLAI